MFSLEEYIRSITDENTRQAENERLTPYVARYDGDKQVRTCKRLGNYVPKNWKKVNTYFVDNSGFGSENEPALTFGQFLTKVKSGRGYAIGEIRQFQVYIYEYIRV